MSMANQNRTWPRSPFTLLYSAAPPGAPETAADWIRKDRVRANVATLVVVSLVIAIVVGASLARGTAYWNVLGKFLVISAFPAILTQVLLWARVRSRLQRFLLESNSRYCVMCGYDLRGSEGSGLCPECGTSFSRESPHDGSWKGGADGR